MEQFSLEKYLANPSRKVVTRAGTSVRILCTDKRDSTPIVALITDEIGREYIADYNVLGKYCDCEVDTSFDLFFAPEKDKEQRFNPKTLKPFDKVLGRDYYGGRWKCGLFSHIMDESIFPYVCIGNSFIYCIPYNDDTKHLAGTDEKAPEYYRYWEE